MPDTDAEPDARFHPTTTLDTTNPPVGEPLSPRPAGRRRARMEAPGRPAVKAVTRRPDWPRPGHSPED
ncbi:hypothetical protein [Rubrivirga marina]|uniref:Uncharacterized protein n=1 Tax=Rubrivirga marina TaxID=1196024 RepID=A0A271IYN8_9BACT|nr:hypothetical protein [Rubrivirga marina]PAP76371.1 hypothetical protein BSZ37_07905 [Rubrivirga marina]